MAIKNKIFSKEFKLNLTLQAILDEECAKNIAKENDIAFAQVLQWKEDILQVLTPVLEQEKGGRVEENLIALLSSEDAVGCKDYEYANVVSAYMQQSVKIVDMDTYEVLYINPTTKAIYGIPDDDSYVGEKCHHLFYGKDYVCEFCNNSIVREQGSQKWILNNDVRGAYVRHNDYMLQIDGHTVKLQIDVDFEEQHNRIMELDGKLYTEQTLFRCIKILSQVQDLKQAIEKTLAIVCEYYDGDRGYIAEMHDDNTQFSYTYEWCSTGISSGMEQLRNLPISIGEDRFKSFDKKGFYAVGKLGKQSFEEPPDYCFKMTPGVESLIAVPLIDNGTIAGFFGIDNPRRHTENMTLLSSCSYFVINDIQKRRMYSELERLSYKDLLTHTYNRNKYNIDIEQMEENVPQSLGVVYVDLNGLKRANDERGHYYGDYMLRELGNLLNESFEKRVYRVGGDEFVVLLADYQKEKFEGRVEKFRQCVQEEETFGVSVGAIWEEQDVDVQMVIKAADKLMYDDKRRYYGSEGLDRRMTEKYD